MDKAKAYLPLPTSGKLAASVGGLSDAVPIAGGAADLNGHKKTVSESETVAGQYSKKLTEIPGAKSEKPLVAKTFRFSRGSLPSKVPRFANKFSG